MSKVNKWWEADLGTGQWKVSAEEMNKIFDSASSTMTFRGAKIVWDSDLEDAYWYSWISRDDAVKAEGLVPDSLEAWCREEE